MEDKHNHKKDKSNIKLAFFLNFGFTIIEIVGGLWINSIAIISDAVHDLGDSLSLGLAWFLDYYSEKEKDETFTYGYKRYSLLATLINTTVLIIGSFIIHFNAIPRLFNPESTSAKGMIGFAILGIIVNGVAVLKTKSDKSLNEKVVSWHLLEDVLGWIAVLIVGIIMLFKDIPILDPILSILITLYILYNVFSNFKETILLFLQAVPGNINIEKIVENFRSIDKVIDTHHTHIWSLDSENHVLTTHLVVDNCVNLEDILKIKKQAKIEVEDLNMEHITIEVELEEGDCSID